MSTAMRAGSAVQESWVAPVGAARPSSLCGVDGWLERREQFGLRNLEGAAWSTFFVGEAAQSDGVATRTGAGDVVENRIGHDLCRQRRLRPERKAGSCQLRVSGQSD